MAGWVERSPDHGVSAANLRQAALSGARWTMATKIGLQLFTWPVTILVMRLLEPGDYGLFAIAILFSGFIVLFAELGLGVALVQTREVSEPMARAAASLVLLLNGAVAAAIVLAAPWVAILYDEPDVTLVMRLLTLELLLAAFAAVPQAMLERNLQFRALSIAQMAAGVAGSLTMLGAALLDVDVMALVAGALVTALVRSVLIIWFHGRLVLPGRVNVATVRPMIHVSSQVVLGRVLWYWYGQADQLVLGRLLYAVQLGYYSVAAQLAMLPASKAMEAVNRVVFPIFSRSIADPANLRDMHLRTVGLLALYGFGVCWGLAAVAREFVLLVLGAKWLMAATPLALLALVAPLRMLCSLHNTTATAVGQPEAATKELVVAGMLMPLAVTAGALMNGLAGASFAWLAAFPFVYLLSNRLTCRAIGVSFFAGLRPLAAPVWSGCVMIASVWLVRRAIGADMHPGLLLAAEVVVGALTYAAMMALTARPVLLEAWTFVRDVLMPARRQA